MHLRFVNPNFHVILVHYPLGVFVLGVFLELFSLFWRRSSVRIAAKWMIVLGALLTLPAATSGIFALVDVKHQGLNAARYMMLRWHVIYMGSAAILAVFCAVIGLGASDRLRRLLYLPLLLGVVVAWGLMVAGAWHGGETIYQQGTSVAIIKLKTPETGDTTDKQPALVPLQEEEHDFKRAMKDREYRDENLNHIIDYWVGGDLQQHLILAGFAFAAAFGALGLSIRRLHASSISEEEEIVLHRDIPLRGEPRRVTDDISVIRSFNPETEVGAGPGSIPSARFWLLTFLLVLATAAVGYWLIVGTAFFTADGWKNFVAILKPEDPAVKFNRYLAHTVLGGAFLLLALICALLAAAAPKRPLLLTLFSSLLILVIAGQVWVGILLTFDRANPDGPFTHFTTADESRLQQERIDSKKPNADSQPAPADVTPPAVPGPATTLPSTGPA